MNYIDQVVKFIEKNTAGSTISSGGGGEDYQDPFTGASRYRASSSSSGPSSSFSDPFTGGSRYVPSAPAPGPSLYNDSFTPPGRPAPQPAAATVPAARSQFPIVRLNTHSGGTILTGCGRPTKSLPRVHPILVGCARNYLRRTRRCTTSPYALSPLLPFPRVMTGTIRAHSHWRCIPKKRKQSKRSFHIWDTSSPGIRRRSPSRQRISRLWRNYWTDGCLETA